MEAIKVGVVGVGHLGQHHARVYTELRGTQLVGVVDTNGDRAKSIGDALGVTGYSDMDRFIAEKKPEAVSIVVPTVEHFEIASRLLNQGIHVLVEKPVTSTVQEAEELLTLAHRKRLVLQVGHIERFNNAIRFLSSDLADPMFIRSVRQGPFVGRIADVGVVLDLMIHDIDIILSLVKSEVKTIVARGRSVCSSHEDLAVAQIEFENGTMADIMSSRLSARRRREMEVTVRDKVYTVDFESQDVAIYRCSHTVPGATFVEVKEHPIFPKLEPLKLELQHFVSCVREGKEPLVGISDGKRALAVAVEILKQIQLN